MAPACTSWRLMRSLPRSRCPPHTASPPPRPPRSSRPPRRRRTTSRPWQTGTSPPRTACTAADSAAATAEATAAARSAGRRRGCSGECHTASIATSRQQRRGGSCRRRTSRHPWKPVRPSPIWCKLLPTLEQGSCRRRSARRRCSPAPTSTCRRQRGRRATPSWRSPQPSP